MYRRDDEPPLRAPVPADVERPDTIMFGLTARQVLIVGVPALVLYAVWSATATVIPPLVFLVAATPIAALVFAVAVGRRDGLPLDRWLLAAITHRRQPHQLAPTHGPVTPAPAWVNTTTGPGDRQPLPAPLTLPARGITGDGVVDLGPDGTVALVSASTVSFGLRTPAEQNGLVAGYARWLNSLDTQVQILIRAERVDLTEAADRIADNAGGLPDPALEEAARSHAAFLAELAAGRELLHRHITLAVRDHRGPGFASHRAAEAVRALAACEVTAHTVHTPQATQAALVACLRADQPPPPTGLARPDAVISGPQGGARR